MIINKKIVAVKKGDVYSIKLNFILKNSEILAFS